MLEAVYLKRHCRQSKKIYESKKSQAKYPLLIERRQCVSFTDLIERVTRVRMMRCHNYLRFFVLKNLKSLFYIEYYLLFFLEMGVIFFCKLSVLLAYAKTSCN